MLALWDLKNAFVNDIIDHMGEGHYNTISSIVRKLEKDGVVGHIAIGRSHKYYAILGKKDYRSESYARLRNDYFSGSADKLFKFFLKEEQIDIKKLRKMLKKLEK